MTDVLALCAANMCRSPMAAALLARELAARDAAVTVGSAGLLADGEPPALLAVMAVADLSQHQGDLPSSLFDLEPIPKIGAVLILAVAERVGFN